VHHKQENTVKLKTGRVLRLWGGVGNTSCEQMGLGLAMILPRFPEKMVFGRSIEPFE
jgi:hypothetical protein